MRSKLNVIKIIVAVISFLILLNLCFGAYLANKTYNVYRKTESVEQYVKNSFIDEKQYVKLSPYMSDVYNSDGTIKENVTNINCDTKYYILYPFVAINEGQFVINGSYSYSFNYEKDGETHSSGAMGEVKIYFGIEDWNIYVSDIRYGI